MVLLSIFVLGPLVTDLELLDYFSSKTTHRYFRNILLLKTHRDLPGVFSNQDPSAINGSLWTLLYEVRFYFLAPFLVWLFYRARKIAVSGFIILACAFFISKFLYPFCGYSPLHEYLRLGYFFSYGVLLNLIRKQETSPLNNQYAFISSFGLLLAAFTPYFLPIYYLFLPLLVIHFGMYPKLSITKKLDRIGDLSYGIYLYSFPIQQLYKMLALKHNLPLTPLVMFGFSLPWVLLLSFFSYYAVEKPALSLKQRRS